MGEPLYGIWADDTAFYLTDLRHPLMRQEWEQWQQERGRRYDSPMGSDRERRDFDRVMLAKYGEQCPPPPRTEFQLVVFDIYDRQEEHAAQQRRLAALPPIEYEEEYIDEAI